MSEVTAATPTPPLGIFPIATYLALPRAPTRWVVEGLLPSGGWMNVYADPKVGKTYAVLQLLVEVASGGTEWLGFPIHRHGPVIHLQLDTPRGEWAARLEALAGQGLDLSSFWTCDKASIPYPFNILDPAHFAWLRAHVTTINPAVVVIDTWRDAFIGSEDSSELTPQALSLLDLAIRPAAGILIQHSKKAQFYKGAKAESNLMGDNRGSTTVNAKMDTVLKLTRKGLEYEGRSVAPGKVKLRRRPDHFWELDSSEIDAHTRAVLADPTYESLAERARALADRVGLTPDACRKRLERLA